MRGECPEKIAPVYIPERRFILHLVQRAEALPDCSTVAQRVNGCGSVDLGPALVHFALSQVLGLNLRFEIHDSDMSHLSLKMALRSSLICSSEGRSWGELTILIWEWAIKRRDDKRWYWCIG